MISFTKRITKRMRAQAARLCSLMASSNETNANRPAVWFVPACGIVGVACVSCDNAAELARLAFYAAEHKRDCREAWASAEAMLRTGWAP